MALMLKRYRTAITIGVIGAMTCVGTVIFSVTMSRGRLNPKAPQTVERNSSIPSCSDSRCHWEETYLKGRLNATVASPCSSFYDYVCRKPWRSKSLADKRFKDQAAGSLAISLRNTLTQYPVLIEALLSCCRGYYPVLGLDFFRACYPGNTSAADFDQLRRLFKKLGLGAWPLPHDGVPPRDQSPWDLLGILDLKLGMWSLMRVSLRRRFGVVHIQLDRSPLPLERYLLTVPHKTVEDYQALVGNAVSLLGGNSSAAQDIVDLEHALLAVVPRETFLPGGRLVHLKDLPRSKRWNWIEYLATVRNNISLLTDGDREVIVRDPEYLAYLTDLLHNTSAGALYNYVGYRTLAHLSPLLPREVRFLSPLSHEMTGIDPQLESCLRLLGWVNPFALRYFSAVTVPPGGPTSVTYSLDDSYIASIFEEGRRAAHNLIDSLPWTNASALARRKHVLATMKMVYAGGNVSVTSEQPLGNFTGPALVKGANFLDSFLEVQSHKQNAVWRLKEPDDRLDTRHQEDMFSIRADYFYGDNVLYLARSLDAVSSIDGVQLEPFWRPKIARPVVRGLLRGAIGRMALERSLRGTASYEKCLSTRYNVSRYDVHLYDVLLDNVSLRPLYELYLRGLMKNDGYSLDQRLNELDLTLDQLFFVNWAVGQCDDPELQDRQRELKRVPTRLLVNVPLSNFKKFHEAFNCPVNSEMRPRELCAWGP
ncbi:endothelin-converting enzyme 2-like [Ornithodoros turicata]|uniref:endothelin-converting enzyme 2-like n=1 Tax=Ornithodoros turicata TaxID=34597 RepID=UPI00313A1570